jgi:hypothetical protein
MRPNPSSPDPGVNLIKINKSNQGEAMWFEKIYPIKYYGKEPGCPVCALFDWPKSCKRVTVGGGFCKSKGTYCSWTGEIPYGADENRILRISDLYGKTAEEIRKIVQGKLDRVNGG